MKKNSRIMMKAAAIILCLVLITSSVVSTTLAKYVITKSAETEITFKKYGLQLDVTADSPLVKVTDSDVKNGLSVSATYKLAMNPDLATADNALRFVFTKNQPSVSSTVSVSVDVELHEKMLIESDNFTSTVLSADKAFMPIEFKVCSTDASSKGTASTLDSWSNKTTVEELETHLETEIAKLIKTELGSGYAIDTNATNTVKKSVGTSAITFEDGKKGIGFGFNWPKSTDTNRSYLETWLAEQFGANDVPITVTYTVSVTQN